MTWQAALRARLLAASPVTALVGQRVYWVERPQGDALPAITLQTINDGREQHLKGFHGLQSSLVQIDVWATTYGQVRALSSAVIDAITPSHTGNGVRFERSFIQNSRDLGERNSAGQFIHRVSTDIIVHHASA